MGVEARQEMLRKQQFIIRPFSFFSSYYFSSSTSSAAIPQLLKVGDVLRRSRRFSQEDVVEYSRLTHDVNPIHLRPESAREAGFDARPLVHGLLVAALFPRIIASHFPGAVYVSQSLQFKLPVYIEDEVVAEVQATNLRENRKRYIAKFSTKCFKNGELIVINGEAVAILPTLAMFKEKPT